PRPLSPHGPRRPATRADLARFGYGSGGATGRGEWYTGSGARSAETGARWERRSERAMRSYLARLRRAPRTVKLFLVFTLLSNIGFGVFQLIYNLYLVRIGLHEDFIGAFSA